MRETVVVTASAGSFPGLAAALQEISVTIEERPLLNFVAPSNWTLLHSALDRLEEYRTVVFTSPRAAEPFAAQLKSRRPDWSAQLNPLVVWASGPQTAAALLGVLGPVRLPQAKEGLGAAKALAKALVEEGVEGPVLFPCGEDHRDELPSGLREHGIVVDEVVCYRSVLAEEAEARMAASRGRVVIVASPRVADLLARACPRGSRPELLAVGPTTAESARMAGWYPAAMATEPTARALAFAVRSLLATR
jgi:uroporphyrinogen-III synthase